MTIKEIETLSGLPRAGIMNLPRAATIQADAEVLLRVKLLRALPWYLVL